jgi:hypothetical protein
VTSAVMVTRLCQHRDDVYEGTGIGWRARVYEKIRHHIWHHQVLVRRRYNKFQRLSRKNTKKKSKQKCSKTLRVRGNSMSAEASSNRSVTQQETTVQNSEGDGRWHPAACSKIIRYNFEGETIKCPSSRSLNFTWAP